MTLNAAEPTDQRVVSSLPTYIRETRVEVNSISLSSSSISANDLTITTGTTTLTVGSAGDLGATSLETIIVTAAGASIIATMTGGLDGQVKIFVFQDNNVDFMDGPKSGGQLYLNHVPALTVFDPDIDDVLALINIGGDGLGVANGYWKELWRAVSVK